jgi:lipopolysaccharide/colanic/teichoic acid biosynthesis glycosyltransferase
MSLRRSRVLETEPSILQTAPEVGGESRPDSAPLPRSKTSPKTWYVSEQTEPAVPYAHPGFPPYAVRANAAAVVEEAQAGDIVMISGLEIQALVETCDRLLSRDVAVDIDANRLPALRGLITKHEFGTAWVRLNPSGGDRFIQLVSRIIDTVSGVAGTIVVAPVLGVLMLGIHATSEGPAIFRSPRIGRDGAGFDLFKLRTMRPSNGPEHEARKELYRDYMAVRSAAPDKRLKVVDDSRVTPIGRFLRKHSLDELPQFWNVVHGDLSLVGPRPCLPYEWDLHQGWHRLRFRGRPGLTGLWQAYGRSRVTFEEMVLMDYCYSLRKSFLLDLRIVLRTAVVVITGEGGG